MSLRYVSIQRLVYVIKVVCLTCRGCEDEEADQHRLDPPGVYFAEHREGQVKVPRPSDLLLLLPLLGSAGIANSGGGDARTDRTGSLALRPGGS